MDTPVGCFASRVLIEVERRARETRPTIRCGRVSKHRESWKNWQQFPRGRSIFSVLDQRFAGSIRVGLLERTSVQSRLDRS